MERFKAWFFIVLGAALIIAAMFVAAGTRQLIADSVVAPGRVVRLSAGGSHPVVSFRSAAGGQHVTAQGGWIAGYDVGDVVRIRYSAAEPDTTAELDAFGTLWFWPILLLVIGGGLALGGALNLAARHRT